jgi:hypothetical protein
MKEKVTSMTGEGSKQEGVRGMIRGIRMGCTYI